MVLNKKTQYAILLSLYLSRSGKAQLKGIAKELSLSISFLHQIARRLVVAGILKSYKGPGGGFALVEDVKIKTIFKSLNDTTKIDTNTCAPFTFEGRVLWNYLHSLKSSHNFAFNKTISQLNQELIDLEVSKREEASEIGTVQ